MHSYWVGSWLSVAAVLASGCLTYREFPAPNLPRSACLADVELATVKYSKATDPSIRQAACKPSNVLVLSGGGMNGAYPAGLLKGWSETGNRPRFDVVTGVSAGALIAPFAFLGEEYDAALERGASLQASDIFLPRLPPTLMWSDSLADSGPLWRLIRAEVTPEVLANVAQAHSEGRRLFVGTTNLDTKRPVVWDLGAIAASNDPSKLDLFRKVLLASSSVPGLLPPVPINVEIDGKRYTELHVDGGVGASLLLSPQMLGAVRPGPPEGPCESTVFVVIAGKLSLDTSPVRSGWFQVSAASLSGLLQSQMEGDLFRAHLLARHAGARFALAGVPEDSGDACSDGLNSMAFDPKTTRQVFEAGRRFWGEGGPWRSEPPGLDPREWQTPRGGVRLNSVAVSAAGAAPNQTTLAKSFGILSRADARPGGAEGR